MLVTRDKGVTVIADGPVHIDKEVGLVRIRVPKKTQINVVNIDSRKGQDWCAPDPLDPAVTVLGIHVTFDDPRNTLGVPMPPLIDVFDASFADQMNEGGFISNEFLGAGTFKVTRLSETEVKFRIDNLCANFPKFIIQIKF